jgi:formiminotetrahydrofolate cyclodeaminase
VDDRPDPDRFVEEKLRDLLAGFSSDVRAPAGGTGSAIVVAIAASLVAKAARLSRSTWPEAAGAIAQAEAMRDRALSLAASDAVVFEEALAALRGVDQVEPGRRDVAIKNALVRAADVPLLIAEVACDVALLAADAAEAGNPELGAEAAIAALLSEAAARSARHLVAVNLATVPEEDRLSRGEELAEVAVSAAKRAVAIPS